MKGRRLSSDILKNATIMKNMKIGRAITSAAHWDIVHHLYSPFHTLNESHNPIASITNCNTEIVNGQTFTLIPNRDQEIFLGKNVFIGV